MPNKRISDLSEREILFSDSAVEPFPSSARIEEPSIGDRNTFFLLARPKIRNEKISYSNLKSSILDNIAVENYGLIKEKIYYGCSFESNVKEFNYQNFDKHNFDIETTTIPFLEKSYINNVFFCNHFINSAFATFCKIR